MTSTSRSRRPSYESEPQIQFLSTLLGEIAAGLIQVPRFQRGFVWTDDQRLELFRSVIEGTPIGSILVWRTKLCLPVYGRLGPHRLPEGDQAAAAAATYLLDGHQRLATLFGALRAPQGDGAGGGRASPGDEEALDGWRVYYDLTKEDFVLPGRQTPEPTWMPLSVALDSVRLIAFLRGLASAPDGDRVVHVAERVSTAIREYKLAVIPIVSDDLSAVTRTFQRVNSQGTPMSEVHMVAALSWRLDFDLAEQLEEVQTKLATVAWEELDPKLVLGVCKLALDLDLYGAPVDSLATSLGENPGLLTQAADNLVQAARFLAEACGVASLRVLPYAYQAVLLAEAVRCVGGRPEGEVSAGLRDWFWSTTYSGCFAGISYARLRGAVEEVRTLAGGGSLAAPPGASATAAALPRRFDFRAARAKALVLRLAERRPQDAGGIPFDAGEALARLGASAVHAIVAGGALGGQPGDVREQARGSENRFLALPEQAAAVRARLCGGGGGDDAGFLDSHCVPAGAAEALRRGDYGGFFRARVDALQEAERAFVGALGLELERR